MLRLDPYVEDYVAAPGRQPATLRRLDHRPWPEATIEANSMAPPGSRFPTRSPCSICGRQDVLIWALEPAD